MSLLDQLVSLFSADGTKGACVFIPYGHIENPRFQELPLKAGKHYFRLWLSEMFLDKRVD
jgi:hypothetical protein